MSMLDKANAINNLFQVILSNGFPRLRICTATGIGSLDASETWTGSPTLRLLVLDGEIPLTYGQIRSLYPNLRQPTRSLHSLIDSPSSMMCFSS